MRSGVWLALTFGCAVALGACSGGYPLPPTRCDEWCDATKGGQCERYYQPASCVLSCEQSNTDTEACRVQFDAVIACFRRHPEAVEDQCSFYSYYDQSHPRLCGSESDALGICVGSQFLGSGPRE